MNKFFFLRKWIFADLFAASFQVVTPCILFLLGYLVRFTKITEECDIFKANQDPTKINR